MPYPGALRTLLTFDSHGDLKHGAISLYEYKAGKKTFARCRQDVVQTTWPTDEYFSEGTRVIHPHALTDFCLLVSPVQESFSQEHLSAGTLAKAMVFDINDSMVPRQRA
jgi:hypothetical protein